MQKSKLGEAEFDTWFETHVNDCQKKHEGSAGARESQNMLKICRRSQVRHGLVYEGYLGDGDSKSFHTVANADPPVYCDSENLECCGHV